MGYGSPDFKDNDNAAFDSITFANVVQLYLALQMAKPK